MSTVSAHAEPTTIHGIAAAVEIQAAAGAGKRPTFDIIGYTGSPMNVEGFFSPVILELSGMKPASQTIPALRSHDPDRIVGQTDAITIGDDVRLSGTITGENADASEVVSQSRNGFRWQASIGAAIDRREFVDGGKTAVVNGRTVAGPLVIVREATLKEISFVALGADGGTSAAIAAKDGAMSILESVESPPDPAAVERDRIKAVRGVAKDFPDIEAKAIDEGWDTVATKAAVLDALRAGRARVPSPAGGNGRGHLTADPVSQLTAGLMLLAGRGDAVARHLPEGARLAEAVGQPSGWLDIAARALRLEGRDVPHGDAAAVVKAAFSTISLPVALGSSVRKLALDVFMEEAASFLAIVRRVPAVDFKPGKALRLAVGSKLEKLGPSGEIKHGTVGEDAYDFRVETYARMIGLTRQDIINDDLSLLSDVPTLLGAESARTISDTLYALLLAEGSTFFTSGRGNLLTGACSALGVAGLSAAIKALRTMRDADGRILNLQPAVLLVPPSLEAEARALLNSTMLQRDQAADLQPMGSPLSGLNLTLVVEPRLEDANLSGNSSTAWYLFAAPRNGAILLATLNGKLGPTVESEDQPFHLLGRQWRAYQDHGVSLAEFRAVIKSAGT